MKKSNQDPRKGRKLYLWRRIVINQPTTETALSGTSVTEIFPCGGASYRDRSSPVGASERDRRPIPTVSVWGQSQTAVVLL